MKNGGDAFPCYVGNDMAERGMTLRDYFAGQAIINVMLCDEDMERTSVEDIAKWAYKIADAMLAEREEKTTEENDAKQSD
jgi:hypothetical protein